MSSKGANPYADWEFLRSCQKEKESMEDEWDVVVNATISLGARAGVLVVRLEARQKGKADNGSPISAYQGEWPNAVAISWPAFLFGAYVRLSRLVEDSLKEMWERENRPQE